MELGFTGTRRGMTIQQVRSFTEWLSHRHGWLHHGDCLGSDERAHEIAQELGWFIAVHPPLLWRWRAGLTGDSMYAAKDYIVRNHDIVDMTRELVATVGGPERVQSGTWATVRYARRVGRRVTLVWPDGSVT